VTFPVGDDSGPRVLSRHDARVLRVQLHLAYLLAGRNSWRTGTTTVARRAEQPEAGVFATEAGFVDDGGDEGVGRSPTGQLPRVWSIDPAGQTVTFIVPASGVDGEFELTDVEALSAGVRLIQRSANARSVRLAIEEAGPPARPRRGG
jgi:hypothetical protein